MTATPAGRRWRSSRPPTRGPRCSPRSRPGRASRTPTRIAALDGVDCLWVGHFDLSAARSAFPASSSIPTSPTRSTASPRPAASTARRSAASSPTSTTGSTYREQGFDFLCYSGDVWALQARGPGRRGRHPRAHRGPAAGGQDAKKQEIAEEAGMRSSASPSAATSRSRTAARPFPVFDLTPLRRRSPVELVFVQPNGVMPAAGLDGLRRADPAGPPLRPQSFPKDGRLAIVARFGVGYDTVDVPPAPTHGIAL